MTASCHTYSAGHLAKLAQDVATGTACKAHGRRWRAKASDVEFSVWPDAHTQAKVVVRCGLGCSRDVRVAP
jgi:hypothetical protein